MFNLKQRNNETVKEFCARVRNEARKADIGEDMVFNAVSTGLLGPIRSDVIKQQPQTLKQLLDCAELSETANQYNTHSVKKTQKLKLKGYIHLAMF